MYTLYKFHFLNGISEINPLFDDILIIWPAPVYINIIKPRKKVHKTMTWMEMLIKLLKGLLLAKKL